MYITFFVTIAVIGVAHRKTSRKERYSLGRRVLPKLFAPQSRPDLALCQVCLFGISIRTKWATSEDVLPREDPGPGAAIGCARLLSGQFDNIMSPNADICIGRFLKDREGFPKILRTRGHTLARTTCVATSCFPPENDTNLSFGYISSETVNKWKIVNHLLSDTGRYLMRYVFANKVCSNFFFAHLIEPVELITCLCACLSKYKNIFV